MANCSLCKYCHPYWEVPAQKAGSKCVAPKDFSMATKEGEHDCPAFKVNEWDEKRVDIVGSNGNIALHYKEIDNETIEN
jgi:hypothetical protein